jgi:hypothetical protein
MGLFLKDHKQILEESIEKVLDNYKNDVNLIKENFDFIFREIENETYVLYLKYEEEFGRNALKLFAEYQIKNKIINNLDDFLNQSGDYFNLFDRFYLSIAQSRKARSGQSFEIITKKLFKILGYPFSEQIIINGKPDFLMPFEKHYRDNPMDCIIFTVKRTLRERWRQIISEGTRGLGFYLATIDQKITENQIREMLNHRIYIVCPKDIKIKYYINRINVISFNQFFKDHLDPAITRWKNNGVI